MEAKAVEGFLVDTVEINAIDFMLQRKVFVSQDVRFLENLKSCCVNKMPILIQQHTDKVVNYLYVKVDDSSIDKRIEKQKAIDPLDVVNNCSMDEDIELEKAVLIDSKLLREKTKLMKNQQRLSESFEIVQNSIFQLE